MSNSKFKWRILACLLSLGLIMPTAAPIAFANGSKTAVASTEAKVLDETVPEATELQILEEVDPPEPSAEDPAEAPAEEPAEAPAEEPAEAPAEEPAEAPAEEPAEAPAEEPAEAPAEEPAEAPAEEPVEVPAEEPAEAPAEEPAEVPAEEPAKEASAEEPAEVPAEEPAKEAPAEGPIQETPAGEPVEKAPVEEVIGPLGSDGIIPGDAISDLPVISDLSSYQSRRGSSKTVSSTSLGRMNITSPAQPGQVSIDKYAKPVPGLVNTWDITLRIEGFETQKSSDIVLVIDRSGSMSERGSARNVTKMADAKKAAIDFIEALKDKPNTRIALVSFASAHQGASTVTTHHGFLNIDVLANRNLLTTAINSLNALGGTNTQAGIKAADTLFNGVPASDRADYNNLVLLSDGLPTQSYRISDTYLTLSPTNPTFISVGNNNYHTAPNRPEGIFNYENTRGDGSSETTEIGSTGSWWNPPIRNYFYNHSNNAISQAKIFKDKGSNRTLWTVALETNVHGNDVLRDIASAGKAFKATSADLNSIFLQIAGSINAAARDVKIIDPMGAGFEVISAITVSQGENDKVTYSGGEITWDVGNLFRPISAGSPIKYAEMTYRVSITPAILDVTVPTDGLYPTNGDAEVKYLDSGNILCTLDFPVPEVNPIFLKVKKILLDAKGDPISGDGRDFSVNILSGVRTDLPYQGFARYNETFVLKHNETDVSTGLRLADTYTITETLPANVTADYAVTIKVNGTVTNTFTVLPPPGDPLDDSGQNDILVEVTNQEKPLGKLILKKILKDPTGSVIVDDPTEFTFTIKGPVTPGVFDGEETRVLKGGEEVTIEGLRYGQYTVTETDPASGYTVTSVPTDGKVTLSVNNKKGTVTITNTQSTLNVEISKNVTGNMGDRGADFAFTATLTNVQGEGIDFPEPPADSGYTVSGHVAIFDLKHAEKVTLFDIPVGSKITLSEDSKDHTVTVWVGESEINPNAKGNYEITIGSQPVRIVVTNEKNVTIPTGIELGSWPYVLLLGCAIAGLGVMITRKRRFSD